MPYCHSIIMSTPPNNYLFFPPFSHSHNFRDFDFPTMPPSLTAFSSHFSTDDDLTASPNRGSRDRDGERKRGPVAWTRAILAFKHQLLDEIPQRELQPKKREKTPPKPSTSTWVFVFVLLAFCISFSFTLFSPTFTTTILPVFLTRNPL